MNIKKYWLEILTGTAASFGLIGVLLWMNMTAITLWWAANMWWILGVIVLVTSICCVKPLWLVYLEISEHLHTRELRKQHVAMVAGVTAKLELGFETSYKNESHGFEINLRNPYTKANQIKIQEVAAQQIEGPRFPQPRDFAQVLETFRPTEQNIFLLDTVNGPYTGPMNEIGHVALASPTGGGKTTTARMVISQVLACGGEMYMVNPNYAPVKLNGNRLEDWRPIAARLKEPPAREFPEIEAMFDRFLDLVDLRRLREQTSPKRGKDLYLFIGEWPAILAQALAISKKKGEDITAKLGRLLRETRQYGVHVISEFQDALVATIGGNSGVRENYRTAYYFGGDDRTAKVVLSLPDGSKPDNTGLGKMGGAMFRFQSNAAVDGRVPFFSNRALYMLLGWPQDPVSDNPVTDMDQVPDEFMPFVDSDPVTPDTQPLRLDESSFHQDFYPRNDEPRAELSSSINEEENSEAYAQENATNEPLEQAQDTSEFRYMLDTIKAEMFVLAYKITGNIDKSLEQIGVHTGYRAHARKIIAERGLRK